MTYQEFQEHCKNFSELVETFPLLNDDKIVELKKKFINQNLILINNVLFSSIEILKTLQNARSCNEIVNIQTKFSHEITKKIALSNQFFLNTSLEQIADYNEWLKGHCDLATD